MAETVNVFGKPMPKPLVIGGIFAVVGIVGYAYWTRGASGGGSEETVDPLEGVPDERIPGASGGTVSGTFSPNEQKYETEQEWFNDAVEKLVFDYGVSSNTIAGEAVDAYLDQRPLSNEQNKMIAYVLNSIGPPPTGARSIRIETPKTSTSPVAKTPTNFRAFPTSGGRFILRWDRVPGATAYEVRGVLNHEGKGWKRFGSYKTDYMTLPAPKKGALAYEVRSVVNSTVSPAARATIRN